MPLPSGEHFKIDGPSKGHVGRVAVAAQHRHMRQRCLQLAGHQPGHGRYLLRHQLTDHDVGGPHSRDLQRAANQPHMAIGHTQHHGLVGHRSVQRIAGKHGNPSVQPRRLHDLLRRHGPKHQARDTPHPGRNVLDHPGNALGRQGITARKLHRPVAAIQVMHQRAEHEATLILRVLADVEALVVGIGVQEAVHEVEVHLPLVGVQEVGLCAVVEIDQKLDGLGTRHRVMPRARVQAGPIVERADALQILQPAGAPGHDQPLCRQYGQTALSRGASVQRIMVLRCVWWAGSFESLAVPEGTA